MTEPTAPYRFQAPPITLPRNAVAAFFAGAGLPLEGARFLLRHPGLWLLVLIPLAINLVLFAVVLGWGFYGFSSLLESWLEGREGWMWATLQVIAGVFFWLVVLIVVYFIFTPMALLVAAPFNDRIAEHAERAHGAFTPEDGRGLLATVFGEALFAVASEAKRLIVFLGVLLLLMTLHLAPVIGSAAYLLAATLWTVWSTAIEFTSFAADRRHLGLRAKWRLLRSNLGASLGYGSATMLLLMVPFLNVLAVPVSAASGARLFCGLRAQASAEDA